MKIGILGTGGVAQTLATALLDGGHAVKLGSRAPGHAGAAAFVEAQTPTAAGRVSAGTFAEAAGFGELLLLATAGVGAVAAAQAADSVGAGKVLIDLTNPLDFSNGFPPTLFTPRDQSLAEQVQAAAPSLRVVKTLNMVASSVMVAPHKLAEPTDLLLCGDDEAARRDAQAWLRAAFGWERFIDMGPLSAARGMEAWLLLWTRLYGVLGTGDFNLRLVRAGEGA